MGARWGSTVGVLQGIALTDATENIGYPGEKNAEQTQPARESVVSVTEESRIPKPLATGTLNISSRRDRKAHARAL